MHSNQVNLQAIAGRGTIDFAMQHLLMQTVG